MTRGLKRSVAVVLPLALAAAVGVPALAGTSSSAGTFLDDVAHRLGVSPAKLKQAIHDAQAARHERWSLPGHEPRFREHERDHGMRAWHVRGGDPHFRQRDRLKPLFAAAAGYLGLSEAALRTQLMAGKTLAQIAAEKQLGVDGLEAAIVGAVRKQLDAAVADGKLTEAQAKRIEGFAAAGIDRFVRHGLRHRDDR
jgi:hypothetical protein